MVARNLGVRIGEKKQWEVAANGHWVSLWGFRTNVLKLVCNDGCITL